MRRSGPTLQQAQGCMHHIGHCVRYLVASKAEEDEHSSYDFTTKPSIEKLERRSATTLRPAAFEADWSVDCIAQGQRKAKQKDVQKLHTESALAL